MPTTIGQIEALARTRLQEITPRFWSSAELTEIIIAGIKDLWRDIVDLKSEHYLVDNTTDVFIAANAASISGVPNDVHKVYLIEPRDTTESNASTRSTTFDPKDFNDRIFRQARSRGSVDPAGEVIYYAITGQGAPVNAPTILIGPKSTSLINLRFVYVPTLPSLTTASAVPIPGEADNALVAWCVSFARAKETDDASPDANWLAIYATEKQHLLQSLGLRQLQEPKYVEAIFEEYW